MTEVTQESTPPKAVVGSQVSHDEEMFGRAFDVRVIRRFLSYCKPHTPVLVTAIFSVLVFTLTQIAFPLVILYAIDNALVKDKFNAGVLEICAVIFCFLAVINYLANYYQESTVGKIAERVLVQLRRDMFGHLQQVSLSFMDRTEVGRLMSRLQGDVNSLQEFLETSVFAIGDLVLLVGIVTVLFILNVELALLTLSIVPLLFIVRFLWLPKARAAFIKAREANSLANGALAEAIQGIKTVQ